VEALQLVKELKIYEAKIEAIESGFVRTREGIWIAKGDEPLLRQYVRELSDLFNDALGPNNYSRQILDDFNQGIANYVHSPSLHSVQNILATVRAARTRIDRNPELLAKAGERSELREKQSVFIIHGRDEAKWRELKEIIRSDCKLNPIVLLEQPDHGCKTVIEKFEHYAPTCSYAIAVFTPDDEVTASGETYLQARPNVIYEVGWFCGVLTRSRVMLLLREGASIFSDFGGVLQKRFVRDVAEKTAEIKRELFAAGILDRA
jgi:predicted nucleotide-binding protein